MTIPPLCILQARLRSTRLERKMLLKLGDETLIARGWRIATDAFGENHCVVAIPPADVDSDLTKELDKIGARWIAPDAYDHDLVSRFWMTAHTYRWAPESVIVRYTPDDPFKDVQMMQRVASGERLPVELGAEAFTLATLDALYAKQIDGPKREHLTPLLFPVDPPKAPAGCWTIDTAEDLEAAKKALKKGVQP